MDGGARTREQPPALSVTTSPSVDRAPALEWDAVPDATRTALLNALRLMLDRAQAGTLDLLPSGGAVLAVGLEQEGVRLLLTIELGTAPSSLSPREMQIARMVAAGATNAAIASALEISRWTVSTHLRRIFAKVGVNSRAEMVNQLFGAPHLPAADR